MTLARHPGLPGHGPRKDETPHRFPHHPLGRHLVEHIILGPLDHIRADAHAFSHAAPGGGYIMGSTHSLAVDSKPANILEMKRPRDTWGSYPINPANFK